MQSAGPRVVVIGACAFGGWTALDARIGSVLGGPEAGYLLARRACEHVLECFIAEGGEYRQAAVRAPVTIAGTPFRGVTLDDGATIEADAFIFACGPWLGRVF